MTAESTQSGILLTAHGSVESLEDMPEFLARIRHGRPAPAGLVEELRSRYRAIGGSPLLRTTEAQARLLSSELGLPVFIGMRLWRPELEDALEQAAKQDVRRLCVLPLAPYSVAVYVKAAERALSLMAPRPELSLVAAQPFGSDPALVAAHAELIEPELAGLDPDDTELILTAHSLPMSVIRAGDRYAQEVAASAQAVGQRVGRSYLLAYQSQGADGGEWLGPTLREALEQARSRGRRHVLVAPIGFLCDHVETLYDLDIEGRGWAAELGLGFRRVRALNDSAALIRTLAGLARRALSD